MTELSGKICKCQKFFVTLCSVVILTKVSHLRGIEKNIKSKNTQKQYYDVASQVFF